MVEQLANYILREKQRGFSDEKITKILVEAGYNKEKINFAFKEAEKNQPLQQEKYKIHNTGKVYIFAVIMIVLLIVGMFLLLINSEEPNNTDTTEDTPEEKEEINEEKETKLTNEEMDELTRERNKRFVEEEIQKCYEENKDPIIIALFENNPDFCNKIDNKEEKDYCKAVYFSSKALKDKDEKLCNKIGKEEQKSLCKLLFKKKTSCDSMEAVPKTYCKAISEKNTTYCDYFKSNDDFNNYNTCIEISVFFNAFKTGNASMCGSLPSPDSEICETITKQDYLRYKNIIKEKCNETI
ncbi:MAG: hypothetical protein ACQESF_00135 [Nanobdellota archaeon]